MMEKMKYWLRKDLRSTSSIMLMLMICYATIVEILGLYELSFTSNFLIRVASGAILLIAGTFCHEKFRKRGGNSHVNPDKFQ